MLKKPQKLSKMLLRSVNLAEGNKITSSIK